MSIIRQKPPVRTVANITTRDAMLNLLDGEEVVVLDSSGDANSTGKAVYKYSRPTASWILLSNNDSLKNVTLTGDVHGSGKDTIETTIQPKTVTFAKLVDVNSGVLVGRVATGAGSPETLVPSQVRTLLSLDQVNNTSDTNKPVSTAQAQADAVVLSQAKSYADGLVVGLWDDRGNYDASTNVYPSTGGSGPLGVILKGDIWTISVAGTLGGTPVVVRQTVRAMTDNPGQTSENWSIGLASTDIDNSITPGVTARAPSQDAVNKALQNEVTARNQAIAAVATGTNTGDETATSIKTKLGITVLSGNNTGDETKTTILNKLSYTPYDAANPAGYQTASQVAAAIRESGGEVISDVYANRPAAGVSKRFFFSTDSEALYFDDGVAWVLVSGDIAQFVQGNIPNMSGTTTISLASSPTLSSGTQLWSQSFTTTPGSSRIHIEVPLIVDSSSSNRSLVVTLFRGNTLIGVTTCEVASSGAPNSVLLSVCDMPLAAGTYVYTCRVGLSGGGTWYVNQDKSGNTLGGNMSTKFTMTEYF